MKQAWDRRARRDAFHYVETANWDRDTERFFALGEERAKILIDPVLQEYAIGGPGRRALDIGCGVGRFTRALASRFEQVVGVDVSHEMVRQARETAAHRPERLTFVEGDGVSLPVGSAEFDFAWSYEVFQHMPSHGVIQGNLREVRRVLKADGYGLIHIRAAHEYPSLIWHLAEFAPDWAIRAGKKMFGRDALTSDKAWRGARPVSESKARAMCRTAGLNVVRIYPDPTHKPGSRIFLLVQPAPSGRLG